MATIRITVWTDEDRCSRRCRFNLPDPGSVNSGKRRCDLFSAPLKSTTGKGSKRCQDCIEAELVET